MDSPVDPYQDPANQPTPTQDPVSNDVSNQEPVASPVEVSQPESQPLDLPQVENQPLADQPQAKMPQQNQQEPSPIVDQPQTPADQPQPQAAPQPQNQQSAQQTTQDPQSPDENSLPPSAESALIPGMARPMPEEILLEWQAPSRPFKQRNRQSFTTIGLICLLIALILIFAGQLLPVAVIIALFFVYYVLNSTPPGLVTHKLTTYGIRVEDTLYYWEEMGRFWFTQKFNEPLLHIEIARFPNRLTLLLGQISKDDMQLILSEVLLNQQPPPTTYEKAAQWFQEKLPIDIES